MPKIEEDTAVLSAIVDAFSLAIIEVCQTLEHQRSLPVAPTAFAGEMKLRAVNLPDDPSNKIQKSILTNIANGLAGEPLAPFHIPE
jgi:hypothetical protein